MHDIAKPAATAPDWAALRRDFPILNQQVHGKPLIYLDSGASSQKPRAVVDAIVHYYEHDHSNVHRGIHELSNRATAAYESARERTARFLNADKPTEIVFTRGTTESINLVAATWGDRHVQAGDKILLTELEHHANLIPWQQLAKRKGAQLVYIPVLGDSGVLDLSKLDELLTKEVKIFAFTHISNTMGTINPAAELCARARALGVVTLVDAAQSAGHCPVDVQEIGCDFLVFSSHKVLGPTGIGVLYGREERFAEMPPYQTGGEMIVTVDWFDAKFKPAPHGFEAGTPDVAGAVGLHAAMDYLDAVGRQNIFDHDRDLAAYCLHAPERTGRRAAVRTRDGPRGAGEFPVGRRARARRGDARRSARHRAAWWAPLQPAPAPQTRREVQRAGELLFLQHPRGSGQTRAHRSRRSKIRDILQSVEEN